MAASLALLVVALAAFADDRESFDVIEVERIDVVEPDGRLAMVISSAARIPGPILAGEEMPRELSGGRTGSAGMLFYNARGDEMGGFTYYGRGTKEQHSASAHLAFDQFRNDQVVALSYSGSEKGRGAGLNVWDRSPEYGIPELLPLVIAARKGEDAERDSARARLAELEREGEWEAHRLYVGSENRDARVVIEDTRSRPRIVIGVDSLDVPQIEILDEEGEVVRSLE